MSSSSYDYSNKSLQFKKIRSFDNLNIQDNRFKSPFKSNSNQFQSNNKDKNVLRQTTNAVFYNGSFTNNNHSYLNSSSDKNNPFYLYSYKPQLSQEKFNSSYQNYPIDSKSHQNLSFLKQNNYKKISPTLNNNTSDHCISNFVKKSDSKYQQYYQNNGINSNFNSGKHITRNQQKQNIGHLANFNNPKTEYKKKSKEDKTSIEKNNVYKMKSDSKRQIASKSYYNSSYLEKKKDNNCYDDYQNIYSIKREKDYKNIQNHYHSKPPLYNYNATNHSQTAPNSFFSKGYTSQRSSKIHSRGISEMQSKFDNHLNTNKQNEIKPKLNKSFKHIDNTYSAKAFLKKQSFCISSNQLNSKFQKMQYKLQHQQRKKSEEVKSKRQKLFLDDFLLGECKGQGRFGKVFLAQHKKTGFICAIKQVKKETLKYIQDQFIQQIKIQYYLNHPNLVKLYGFFSDRDSIYLIMEYMEGGSLYSKIKKQKKIQQYQAALKLLQIASGLQFMHSQSIVHRDIKPQNIVMTHNICKICDFGWSTICLGRRKTYCGTLDYVSPQVLSGQQYNSSVDIWCFGVLAYEMMVGKAPFYDISKKQTINKIQNCNMNCPENLSVQASSFIENILQKNPGRRLNIQQILHDKFFQKIKQN